MRSLVSRLRPIIIAALSPSATVTCWHAGCWHVILFFCVVGEMLNVGLWCLFLGGLGSFLLEVCAIEDEHFVVLQCNRFLKKCFICLFI